MTGERTRKVWFLRETRAMPVLGEQMCVGNSQKTNQDKIPPAPLVTRQEPLITQVLITLTASGHGRL